MKLKRDKHGRVADALTHIRAFGIHIERIRGRNVKLDKSYSGCRKALTGWNKWANDTTKQSRMSAPEWNIHRFGDMNKVVFDGRLANPYHNRDIKGKG